MEKSPATRAPRTVSRPASVRGNITNVVGITKSAKSDKVYGPVYSKNDPIAFSVTQRREAGAGGTDGGGVDPTVRMKPPSDYPKETFFFTLGLSGPGVIHVKKSKSKKMNAALSKGFKSKVLAKVQPKALTKKDDLKF